MTRRAQRHTRRLLVCLLISLVVVAALVASLSSSFGLDRRAATITVHGLRWPTDGSSAAWVSGVGELDGPAATGAVPIASVAKVMTAYVVLRDHPLSAGSDGPAITVSPAEADAYADQRSRGESLVPVAAGERITERQALQALLLPSADNIAWILARWDAGTVHRFVDRMNATARELKLTRTHYTDPSGLDSSTESTAADQVRLGRVAINLPALAAVVGRRTATIPVAGRIDNLDTLLGSDGIIGMKTGSTSAAGGCVLLVARRGSTTAVVAVFGQPGSASQLLPRALAAGRSLVIQIIAGA